MATQTSLTDHDVTTLLAQLDGVKAAVAGVIVGQQQAVEQMLIGLLAGGHCLIEGVPGLGKTLMVSTLAQAMQLSFRRIQFTPDLMPSDIIGTEILEEDHTTGKRFFKFQPGPVFANIVLADEINRTPAKTQAALLEAMQERAVTYAGETHQLDPPFFVLATQNPLEQTGTYALPEAQLDRFVLHIKIDYPSGADELDILRRTTGEPVPAPEAVVSAATVRQWQSLTRQVSVSDGLFEYIAQLVRSTRPSSGALDAVNEWVRWGAGPRAGQALVLAAKAHALLRGRYGVTRADVHSMLLSVLRHRIILNFHAQAESKTVTDVVSAVLEAHPGPTDPVAT